MPTVTFLLAESQNRTVSAQIGENLMRAAVAHGVDGIIADCGGAMGCATCHVFVEREFLPLLAPPSEMEDQMLDFTAAPRAEGSRLACQVMITEALDGLRVRVAERQL